MALIQGQGHCVFSNHEGQRFYSNSSVVCLKMMAKLSTVTILIEMFVIIHVYHFDIDIRRIILS
jgi:hypothetical protein